MRSTFGSSSVLSARVGSFCISVSTSVSRSVKITSISIRKSLFEKRVRTSSVSGVSIHSRRGITPSPVSSRVREEDGVSGLSEKGESDGEESEGELPEESESDEDQSDSDGASGVDSDEEVSSGAGSEEFSEDSGAGSGTGDGAGSGSGTDSGGGSGAGGATGSEAGAGSGADSPSCATIDTAESDTNKIQTTRKCLPKKEKNMFGVFQWSSIIESICVVVL